LKIRHGTIVDNVVVPSMMTIGCEVKESSGKQQQQQEQEEHCWWHLETCSSSLKIWPAVPHDRYRLQHRLN